MLVGNGMIAAFEIIAIRQEWGRNIQRWIQFHRTVSIATVNIVGSFNKTSLNTRSIVHTTPQENDWRIHTYRSSVSLKERWVYTRYFSLDCLRLWGVHFFSNDNAENAKCAKCQLNNKTEKKVSRLASHKSIPYVSRWKSFREHIYIVEESIEGSSNFGPFVKEKEEVEEKKRRRRRRRRRKRRRRSWEGIGAIKLWRSWCCGVNISGERRRSFDGLLLVLSGLLL